MCLGTAVGMHGTHSGRSGRRLGPLGRMAGGLADWRTGRWGAAAITEIMRARGFGPRKERERGGHHHVTFLPLRETVVWMNFKKCRSNGQSEGFIKVNPCLHSFSTLGHKTDGKNGSLL